MGRNVERVGGTDVTTAVEQVWGLEKGKKRGLMHAGFYL